MMKKFIIMSCIALLAFTAVTGCGKKVETPVPGQVETFSKKDTDKANKENTTASINGKELDENTVNDIKNSLQSNAVKGLPQGFPKSIPIYKNAEILEANAYGTDGYNVVYSVSEKYKKVVDFYMSNIKELDDSGVGEEESYFEGMDIGDIHINGLTITDAGDKTQVFITLRDYSKAQHNDGGDDGSAVVEAAEEEDETESIKYSEAVGVPLKKGYPEDVVPVYPKAKVIDCSMTPSGDGGFAELVLPPKSYKDAVSFYKEELGLNPEKFDSEVMSSETFNGEVKGWRVSVQVAELKFGDNDPSVSITIDKN
ncbi:hypothetical protein [Petroclostridium sp. X23]|uniref:hypothetical protein n=1 Tax=Petroclostridium sp. X23 TaxID=3045146 RepID=UPI0024ADBD1E|nr:hypothetical protein [Petroclostridium sp. X23]WHH61340.1 hypothetical protein QKW49_11825 [Petroclostridium sp. X23]